MLSLLHIACSYRRVVILLLKKVQCLFFLPIVSNQVSLHAFHCECQQCPALENFIFVTLLCLSVFVVEEICLVPVIHGFLTPAVESVYAGAIVNALCKLFLSSLR